MPGIGDRRHASLSPAIGVFSQTAGQYALPTLADFRAVRQFAGCSWLDDVLKSLIRNQSSTAGRKFRPIYCFEHDIDMTRR
jgi:hypothetical protein